MSTTLPACCRSGWAVVSPSPPQPVRASAAVSAAAASAAVRRVSAAGAEGNRARELTHPLLQLLPCRGPAPLLAGPLLPALRGEGGRGPGARRGVPPGA